MYKAEEQELFITKVENRMNQLMILLSEMDSESSEAQSYVKELSQLSVIRNNYLEGIKKLQDIDDRSIPQCEEKIGFFDRVDPNVLIQVGANLAGIFAVLNYEKLGVIASKAFGMIFKVRV